MKASCYSTKHRSSFSYYASSMKGRKGSSINTACSTDDNNCKSISSSNCCSTCGRKRAWLMKFKKCGNCHLSVCRRCTIGGQNLVICGLCQQTSRKEKQTSNNWSFASGPPRTNTRVITSSKVREYLEKLIEKQLGGSPLDLANVSAANHPHYRKFVQNYHEKLTNTVIELGKSLHLRPADYDNDDNPTIYSQPAAEPAHDNFTKLLVEVKEAAMEVGPLDEDQTVISKSLHDEDPVISMALISQPVETNYEEILSTAILNKVITDVSLGDTRKSLSPVISVVDSAVQTDNDGELSGTGSGKYNVKSWVDGFSNFSDDDISLGTSSSNWSGGDGINPPVVQQIEEHVEITYETNETDTDTSEESPLPQQQRPRKTKKLKQQPVPFPEHGVDIIDSPEELEEDEPSKKISQVLAWEQNWLFKRKKKPILFSKMAAESVPMLVPNPSAAENELNEVEKLSDIEDDDFVGGYFEFPEDHPAGNNNDNNVNNNNTNDDDGENEGPFPDIKWPQDVEIAAGKTVRVSITITDPEMAPPVWRSVKTKRILTSQSDKIEIKADPPKHALIIRNAQDNDGGLYEVVLKKKNREGAGSEFSRNFRINVKAAEKKKFAPVITVFPDVVQFTKSGDPLSVDFELSGHPEPVLNVFKGNDIITSLENKGKGRWTLTLRRESDQTSETIPGEYIAVATNTLGTTRATFKIEEKPEATASHAATVAKEEEKMCPTFVEAQIEMEPRSSSASPAEETLKETSQSIVTNETLELEEDEQNRRFTVAEREKSKWANPIKLDFNPYAPENLAKRIRAGRSNRDLIMGTTGITPATAEDGPEPVMEEPFFKIDRRDLKKQVTPEPNIVMVEKPSNILPSDLGGVKLPSVKELAQQFSPLTEKSSAEISKPLPAHRDVGRAIQLRKSQFDTFPRYSEPRILPRSKSLVSDTPTKYRDHQPRRNSNIPPDPTEIQSDQPHIAERMFYTLPSVRPSIKHRSFPDFSSPNVDPETENLRNKLEAPFPTSPTVTRSETILLQKGVLHRQAWIKDPEPPSPQSDSQATTKETIPILTPENSTKLHSRTANTYRLSQPDVRISVTEKASHPLENFTCPPEMHFSANVANRPFETIVPTPHKEVSTTESEIMLAEVPASLPKTLTPKPDDQSLIDESILIITESSPLESVSEKPFNNESVITISEEKYSGVALSDDNARRIDPPSPSSKDEEKMSQNTNTVSVHSEKRPENTSEGLTTQDLRRLTRTIVRAARMRKGGKAPAADDMVNL